MFVCLAKRWNCGSSHRGAFLFRAAKEDAERVGMRSWDKVLEERGQIFFGGEREGQRGGAGRGDGPHHLTRARPRGRGSAGASAATAGGPSVLAPLCHLAELAVLFDGGQDADEFLCGAELFERPARQLPREPLTVRRIALRVAVVGRHHRVDHLHALVQLVIPHLQIKHFGLGIVRLDSIRGGWSHLE